MIKVKTFTTEIRIFHAMNQLENLDVQVNQFIAENKIDKVVSVGDTATTDTSGATIGLIRVLAYEEKE